MKDDLAAQLHYLFKPRSVAIIGASERPDNPGTMLMRAIIDMGFTGELYPVNRRHEEILGCKCYASITAVGRPVDLAVLAIPPGSVPAAVRGCAASGVRNCIINSAGFSETGRPEGRRLELEVLEAAAGSGMRLVGPNCLGVYSSSGRIALFGGQQPSNGTASVISQSGSIASILYILGAERGVTFSKMVSSGNELDLNCSDYLDYLAEDSETEIIIAYLEQVRDARRFLDIARRMAGSKPLLVWRAGLTETGSRAASSHTAALSGDAGIWEAARTQAGIVPVYDMADAADVLSGFYHLPAFVGNRVCVISPPGGIAVNSADAAESNGIPLPRLAASTVERLARVLPAEGTGLANPVDMGFGAVAPGRLAEVMRIAASDPGIDLLLVVTGAPAFRKGDPGLFKMHTAEIKEAAASLGKPVVVVGIPSGFAFPYMAELSWSGIPCYQSPNAAFGTLARVLAWQRARFTSSSGR